MCICAAPQNTTKMVLTTGAVSPLVIPFASTFSGPLPLPIWELTLPEITSPPIDEDIANPPIVPTVLYLGNGPHLVAYPLGTPAVFWPWTSLELTYILLALESMVSGL